MDGEPRGAFDPAAMFDLSGKVAVVTGCRRGIGLAMAEALAGAGADIIGVSAQLEASGSEVARRVEAAGRRFTGFAVDLGDRAAVEELASNLAERAAPIDILVNNAGTIARTPALDHDDLDVGADSRGQPDRPVPARAGTRQRNGRSAAPAR